MNKVEFIKEISVAGDLSKKDAEAALNAFISVVTKELTGGGDIVIAGFGKFSVSNRKARDGINPATGAPIKIKASKVAKFKAGSALKASVNGK